MYGRLPAIVLASGVALFGAALSGCGPSRAEIKERHDQADYHYQLAFGYLFDPNTAVRDVEMALQESLKAIETDPDHPEAHFLYALILMGRERYLEAVEHYQRAITLKPDYYFAHANLAATYLAMERWDDAIKVLEPLVANAHFTTPGNGYNNLGWAWYQKGDRPQARKNYVRAIQLAPKLCPAYNNYALLLIDEDNLEKAKENLEEAIRRCPGYAEPHFHLGRIQMRDSQAPLAVRSFRKCLDLSGDTPLADRCKRQLALLPAEEAP
jgi:tetratricopeptide (TPR) repeat protein